MEKKGENTQFSSLYIGFISAQENKDINPGSFLLYLGSVDLIVYIFIVVQDQNKNKKKEKRSLFPQEENIKKSQKFFAKF